MSCDHDATDLEVAILADGMCPLCLSAALDSEASEHARTREQRDDHALREEEANDRWRNVRTAVGEAYGEMDRFDDDPPEFIRWAHEHEQTEFWGRVKAEAALAAATKDAERLDWLENNVYVGFELEPEQGQEDHTNWRTAIDAAKGEK